VIPFDFAYYRPDTIDEALDAYRQLHAEGKTPVYYGGGSELISMARVGSRSFGAVIDLKRIPECGRMEYQGRNLFLGSALTLSAITEADYFPLLSKAAGRIADHTMQCKITLGGNLAASIIYRETALPLLLAEATALCAGPEGLRECAFEALFQRRLQLREGEFLVGVSLNQSFFKLPYCHIKKTRNEKIDYPLLTAASLKKDGRLRIAFSGLADGPFRDGRLEEILNDARLSFAQRADGLVTALSGCIQSDLSGSAEYRKFVLRETVLNILETMEEE